MSPARLATLASGLAITILGALLLAQQEGSIDIEGGWLLAVIAALSGVALVASGFGARQR
jgi:hypothetical protein